MKDEIIGKLRSFLAPIRDESEVVYLLTQVRKALERDMEFAVDKTAAKALGLRLSTMRLYCNLALHT